MWFCSSFGLMNPFSQTVQLCGKFLVWFLTTWDDDKIDWPVNCLEQYTQVNGFSFVWIRMWCFRSIFWPNFTPHCGQTKSLRPWCTVITCLVKLHFRLNDLSQNSHESFWSFWWIVRMCCWRPNLRPNLLPHWSHLCGFTVECLVRWRRRSPHLPVEYEHIPHAYFFFTSAE